MTERLVAQRARIDRTRAASGRALTTRRRVLLNVTVVLALVGAAVVLLARVGGPTAGAAPTAVLFMAGIAASGGSAAAPTLVFAGWLTGDPQLTWVGLVVGWYSLLAVPLSVVRGFGTGPESFPAAGLVLVDVVAVVLWLLVLVAPPPPTGTRLLRKLTGVMALVLAGTVLWAVASPALAETVADSPAWRLTSALVWIAGGLVVVARATVGRVAGLEAVGAGLALIGAIQVGRFVLSPVDADTVAPLAALRLLAVAVVLGGSLWLLRRTLLQLNQGQASQEEELRRAEVRLARAAERDHDLRNGLAGLAGAAAVLGGGTGTGDLSQVVASELRRLDVLLTGSSEDEPGDLLRAYEVAPALDGLVMLRRSAGMDVRADVEPGLCALGAPSALAQVVINLIANAERHAPGSPIRIAASRQGERVEVRVRDFGPGVAAGRERAVLEPGTRDEHAGGLGLGLHLCRTLLLAQGATIEILPADPRSPGCLVVIGLLAGERSDPEGPRQERTALGAAP